MIDPEIYMRSCDIMPGMMFDIPKTHNGSEEWIGTWMVEAVYFPRIPHNHHNKYWCSKLTSSYEQGLVAHLFCFDLSFTKSRFNFRFPE